MKIALVGAAGRTGRCLTKLALEQGHHVVALVRDKKKLDISHPSLTIVEGNAHDKAALSRVLEGVDAVVSALGPNGNTSTCCEATKAILEVMRARGVKRYILVSGAGVDAPGDQKGLPDRIAGKIIRWVQPNVVADKEDELKALLGHRDVEWIAVRPPRLVDGDATGKVRHSTLRPPSTKVRRADLAQFMLDQLVSSSYVRAAPFVAN